MLTTDQILSELSSPRKGEQAKHNITQFKDLEKQGIVSILHIDREALYFKYKGIEVEFNLYTNKWLAYSYAPDNEGFSSTGARDCLERLNKYYLLYVKPYQELNTVEATRRTLEALYNLS
jgi:hypothetical protein